MVFFYSHGDDILSMWNDFKIGSIKFLFNKRMMSRDDDDDDDSVNMMPDVGEHDDDDEKWKLKLKSYPCHPNH